MNLVLESITKKDYNNIYKLTTNPDVMKYIGNGQIWNSQKVSKFIHYCLEEEKMKDSKREQYYYKIMDYTNKSESKKKSKLKSRKDFHNGKFIGIIGFHKFIKGNEKYLTVSQKKRSNEFYLTIYFNPESQGKGYFPISMKLLTEKMKKHQPSRNSLYLMVREDNLKMNMYSNKNYQFVSKIKMSPILILNEYKFSY